ncbi:MAG: hypothetical protein ACI8P5_002257 [Bacteroidia bacterium]|jgi:hypothetical protein
MSRTQKIISYVLLVFVFQEVLFRVSFPLPELSNFDRASFVLKAGDSGQFVRNKSFNWWSLPDTTAPSRISYNMYGFRSNEWSVKRQKGKKRVMFVGDSFVEGIMAPQGHSIPDWFKRASDNPRIEVMNAGMLGVGMKKYLQFIADAVPVFRPNVVFLVVYANDFTTNEIEIPAFNLAAEYYDNSRPRFLELIRQYQLGNPIPFRKTFWPQKLLPSLEDPAFPYINKVDQMYAHADSSLVESMCKAEFNPYKLNEMFRMEKALRERANFLIPLDFFRYYAEKFEFEPVVVFMPSRNQVTNHYLQFDHQSSLKFNRNITFADSVYNLNQERLGEVCSRLGLKYYDLTEEIKKQESAGNHLYWNYDDHMRSRGYEFAGRELYRRWND